MIYRFSPSKNMTCHFIPFRCLCPLLFSGGGGRVGRLGECTINRQFMQAHFTHSGKIVGSISRAIVVPYLRGQTLLQLPCHTFFATCREILMPIFARSTLYNSCATFAGPHQYNKEKLIECCSRKNFEPRG